MLDLSKVREKTVEEKRLLQRKAKLEARIARLQKKEQEQARKDDTHRKVVLGAILLAGMRAGAIPADTVRKLIAKFASEKDKKAFDGSPLAVTAAGAESVPPEAPDAATRE